MHRFAIAFLVIAAALVFVGVAGAVYAAPHEGNPGGNCDAGLYKVETNDGDIVLDEGTVFCVKQENSNTGTLVADGETTLGEYAEQAGLNKGVSNYVVYEEAPPSTTPEPTSTSTPTEAPGPTPTSTTTPTDSPSPTVSATPSTAPSGTPTPTSPAPLPTLPNTAAGQDVPEGTEDVAGAFIVYGALLIGALFIGGTILDNLMARIRCGRRS